MLLFLFTLQYIIFFINLRIDLEKLEKWLIIFSILMSLVIIVLFVLIGNVSFFNVFTIGRMWGVGYIPGWPNSTPIPLLFGLFLNIKNNKSKIFSLIIILGIMLTTSRGGLLGMVAIISYFEFTRMKNKKIKGIFLLLPAIVLILFSWNSIITSIFKISPGMEHRMTVTYDRQDIFFLQLLHMSHKDLF